MKPLKKRLESLFKTLIEAELTNQSLSCAVREGHSRLDKPATPYLLVLANTRGDSSVNDNGGFREASLRLILISDNDDEDSGKKEADIENYLDAAVCAVEDLTAIQTETQANYTDLHVHGTYFDEDGTEFEDCLQYDLVS